MKIQEKVIKKRLRKETEMSENQFELMPGITTVEPVF